MLSERGRLRSGGDGGGGRPFRASPPVGRPGAVLRHRPRCADGTARWIPTPRLPRRCVWPRGVERDKVGSASRTSSAIGRHDVSAPRFLTLGDGPLELALHNVAGHAGSYTVTGQYESEPGSQSQPGFERSLSIGAGERKRESFQLKPGEVGLTRLALRVSGLGGVEVKRTLTFDVKVPAGDIKRMTVATLAPKGGKITLSSDLVRT